MSRHGNVTNGVTPAGQDGNLTKAQIVGSLISRMDSHEEMKVKLDPNQEDIKASKEEILTGMKAGHEEMRACHGPGKTEIKTGLEEIMTTDLKASSEEVEVIVPDKETTAETIRALEDPWIFHLPCHSCKFMWP
jgi:hypothetical protein